ncbi:MAG: molybdate ABC transporter substrate-binding protein [Planctomycetota bacterium]|nr:molybdate ABC transporter substrate-binding protein [Planctomycetota bacterium]
MKIALGASIAALLVLASCRDAKSTSRPELNVYAAASLRDVLTAQEPLLERECDVDVVFNFGSSGDLARQITAAGKADVFFSAGDKEMADLVRQGLVDEATKRQFVSNQLVVIEAIDVQSAFESPFRATNLTAPGVARISLADTQTVPAGRYAKAWLESVGVWPAVSSRVLPGVDVRAALAAVESGSAQVGIVYATDAVLSQRVRVVFAVPLDEGPRIVYPLAALARRPLEKQAQTFVTALSSGTTRAAFARFGFVVTAESHSR